MKLHPLASSIRFVPDFPKPGIVFRDITTLLADPKALREALDIFSSRYKSTPIDKIVGIESRGFVLGAALADRLNVGFIPARKPGKLPFSTIKQEYELEYGKDAIEMHSDALRKGERVLVHDDLLATGGTAAATCALIEHLGARVIGCSFLIELLFLKGSERLKQYELFSIIKYEAE